MYLTTDGGHTWTATAPDPVLGDFNQAWATSDGRLVVCAQGSNVAGRVPMSCKVSADGAHFAEVSLVGLPPTAVTTDGFAARTDHAMYTSADGLTWHEVWHD